MESRDFLNFCLLTKKRKWSLEGLKKCLPLIDDVGIQGGSSLLVRPLRDITDVLNDLLDELFVG